MSRLPRKNKKRQYKIGSINERRERGATVWRSGSGARAAAAARLLLSLVFEHGGGGGGGGGRRRGWRRRRAAQRGERGISSIFVMWRITVVILKSLLHIHYIVLEIVHYYCESRSVYVRTSGHSHGPLFSE